MVYWHSQQNSWASYQIRKIAGCACAGNAGNVFLRRRVQRKPLVSDPGMHHGTCVTHMPWCMTGSLTRGGGENVPGIPGACARAILRIWQEAHWIGAFFTFSDLNSKLERGCRFWVVHISETAVPIFSVWKSKELSAMVWSFAYLPNMVLLVGQNLSNFVLFGPEFCWIHISLKPLGGFHPFEDLWMWLDL